MFAEIEMCGLDPCQSVSGNWFMLIGGAFVMWLMWKFAP
jgi:hypothetical protein